MPPPRELWQPTVTIKDNVITTANAVFIGSSFFEKRLTQKSPSPIERQRQRHLALTVILNYACNRHLGLVVSRIITGVLYDEAVVAADLDLGSGIRAIHDNAMAAADACGSLFPWPSV
jgi:hypothetical protein